MSSVLRVQPVLTTPSLNRLKGCHGIRNAAAVQKLTRQHIRTIGSVPEPRHSSTAVHRSKAYDAPITSKTESQHPLSVMPTTMLLRSLFVATVSSNRFLLIPSLSLLSFFSKPGRSFLFNVDRNPLLRGLLKRTFYKQFCAGESEKETRVCVRQLKDLGFRGVILTYAKEIVFDHKTRQSHHLAKKTPGSVEESMQTAKDADIEAWRVGTLKTVDMMDGDDILAVKMTGAGIPVAEAFNQCRPLPTQMLDALHEISQTCKDKGIRIIVDAESQHFQAGISSVTLDLMRKYNRDGFAVIYNTYQAYLKDTPNAVKRHLEAAANDGFTLGLKLVRGAYILSDDRSLIHDTKQDTDNTYNGIAQGALRQQIGDFGDKRPFPSVNLFLASHNRESVIAATKLHRERAEAGLPTVPVAFGQLHGMSDEVSFSLLQEKSEGGKAPEVYKCSTWGSMGECLGYLVRRAVENRDAVLRTTDELNALRGETRRRIRSIFTM